MSDNPKRPTFDGLRVLSLESRRATEIGELISRSGGVATVAPSMREVPIEENPAALIFARDIENGAYDMVIWMTGVGARYLCAQIAARGDLEPFLGALRRTTTIARGPKPSAALRELEIPIALSAPSPNTWREVLSELDAQIETFPVRGQRVAVQEYGAPNDELVLQLQKRGAIVTGVTVYKWALPLDLEPLRRAIESIIAGEQDVLMLTTGTQIWHFLRVAGEMNLENELREALSRVVIASVGPTTTEALQEAGFSPDIEPEIPKMGQLVRETARLSGEILARKRAIRDMAASAVT